jgi:hypothetical protein
MLRFVAAVAFEFDGIHRAVDEHRALWLAEKLEARQHLSPTALVLAEEIRYRAETGLSLATPSENIVLDGERKRDVRDILDQADLDAELDAATRSLQAALYGERLPGEPPPPVA